MTLMNLIDEETASGVGYLTLGRAKGTLLAITHGWRDSALAWQWVIKALDGAGANPAYPVVAVQRQAGDHAGLESAALLEAYAGQVVDAVMTAAAPLERVVLIGQSMGGAVAELAAVELGERVAGLAIVTPSPLAGSSLPVEVVELFEDLCAKGSEEAAAVRLAQAYRPSDEVRTRFKIATPEESARSCQESFYAWWGGHPAGRQLSRVKAPTMLVVTDDTFFPETMLRASVAPRFQDIEIAEMRGVGHNPHLEAPERLAEVISTFIDRL